MKNWFTIEETADITGIIPKTIETAYSRENLIFKKHEGKIYIDIRSVINYWPEKADHIRKSLFEAGMFKVVDKEDTELHKSVKDETKIMTKIQILKSIWSKFMAANTIEQEQICRELQAEFPDCKGLSVQVLRKVKRKYQVLGESAFYRKSRTDRGKQRIGRYDGTIDEFLNKLEPRLIHQSRGHNNKYDGMNISLGYRQAVKAMVKDYVAKYAETSDYQRLQAHAKMIYGLQNERMLRDEVYKMMGVQIPTYYRAYEHVQKNGLLIVAHKKSINMPSYDNTVLPLHRFDYWYQYGFMESIQSDGHKLDAKARMVDEETEKVIEKTIYGILWQEAKTGYVLSFDLHLREINSGMVGLSVINLIDKYGLPDSWRFDNGREYNANYIIGGLRTLYNLHEFNDREIISLADAYRGRQKSPENLFNRLEMYLKDCEGYSGGDRKSGPKLTLGTASPKAALSFDDINKIIDDIITSINHKWVEIDPKYTNISVADISKAIGLHVEDENSHEFLQPKIEKNGKIVARRVDIFNALMAKHTKRVVSRNELVMRLGYPEKHTVRNCSIRRTFCGEEYIYIPSETDLHKLMNYHARQVTTKFDPDTSNNMSTLHLFDMDTEKYITSVYCDLLRGYTKEQGDEYNKLKRKANQLIAELYKDIPRINILKERLEMETANVTAEENRPAGTILKFTPEAIHFDENRNNEEEVFERIAEIREENTEVEWEWSPEEGLYINTLTGELSDEIPVNQHSTNNKETE